MQFFCLTHITYFLSLVLIIDNFAIALMVNFLMNQIIKIYMRQSEFAHSMAFKRE